MFTVEVCKSLFYEREKCLLSKLCFRSQMSSDYIRSVKAVGMDLAVLFVAQSIPMIFWILISESSLWNRDNKQCVHWWKSSCSAKHERKNFTIFMKVWQTNHFWCSTYKSQIFSTTADYTAFKAWFIASQFHTSTSLYYKNIHRMHFMHARKHLVW